MASSSDSSTSQGTSHLGAGERQDLRQEVIQIVLDVLNQRDRQRGSVPPPDLTGTNPNGQARSTTSTDSTAQAPLKASEIGYFFPNMLLD